MLSDNSNFLYSRHVRVVGVCRLQLTKRYVVELQNFKINRKDNMILLYYIKNNNFWAQI